MGYMIDVKMKVVPKCSPGLGEYKRSNKVFKGFNCCGGIRVDRKESVFV